MSEYLDLISQCRLFSMDDFIRISQKLLPPEYKSCPWNYVNHGVGLLETEEQLCAYIVAYGEMHQVKCKAAFQNFPFESLTNFEIVDWGCGQGIATLTLIDMLRERGKLNLFRQATLIEPSLIALSRAQLNVNKASNGSINIIPINKYLPGNKTKEEITGINYTYDIVIHLFSNILDISTIDLAALARIVGTDGPTHYIMCMGPKNSGAYRIDHFCNIFDSTEVFSDIDNAQYGYTSNTHKQFGCRTKCLKFKNGYLNIENIRHLTIPILAGNQIYDDYDTEMLVQNNVLDKNLYDLNQMLMNLLEEQDSIYLKPNINGDIPDAVVVRPNKGIMLILVCNSINAANIDTIKKYQQNLIQLHIQDMMGRALTNRSSWGIVKMVLYFPQKTTSEIRSALADKYVYLYGRDILEECNCQTFLKETKFNHSNYFFDNNIYNSFIRIIAPQWHSYKQGKHINLTKEQEILTKSEPAKKQKINGVAGSGKTQVLANRAVNAHLRTGRPILVLTYNLTLVNYIRYRIGEVRADFSWSNIVVTSYHQLFTTAANNYQLKMYCNNNFSVYEDITFFNSVKNKITRYAAILIDEVQDYKREWLKILHDYFLEPNGEFVVFGDAKQNIYNRPLDSYGQIRLEFIGGKWNNSLNKSHRFVNSQLAILAMKFQQEFYANTEIDEIEPGMPVLNFDSCINYYDFSQGRHPDVAKKCIEIIQENQMRQRDVVILSKYCEILRNLDYQYRILTQQSTITTFETKEDYDQLYTRSNFVNWQLKNEIKQIRRNKKNHFSIDANCLKLSTIYSFKGWESKTVILILTSPMQYDRELEDASGTSNEEALVYTAITRAKENLFIINLGNSKYHSFFKAYTK